MTLKKLVYTNERKVYIYIYILALLLKKYAKSAEAKRERWSKKLVNVTIMHKSR